ncbi:hypothetical protein G6F38_013423 [Rhizopus arrhizus]|nr:hypothetical protein G6F38_013423 [Rhizopus arrhizus]
MNTAGQNALASVSNQGYRPRLIEFHGYEGEDFRHFLEILESFLAISNTHNDSRKLVILKSQLHTWYRGPYAGLRPELDGA